MTSLEDYYCIIPLTQGQIAFVDPDDYERLMEWRWCAHWLPTMNTYRAVSRHNSKMWYMSRVVLGLEKGNPLRADHINGNPLDNRKCNLRAATQAQNGMNRGKTIRNNTGYKGVRKSKNGYVAQIAVNGVHKYLGYKETAKEAYQLYCAAAFELHGEFARIK